MRREYDVNGRKLQIHLGDITQVAVAAIVSSENSDLIMARSGGPSVSGAIRAIEGEEFARELARMGPIEPGRAVVTPARHLSCRWVIHAASVIKTERGHESSLTVIRSAVRSALTLAVGLGLDSVAFPAFGVRATQISRQASSQAMVEEIVAALQQTTSLRRVVIALLDAESFLAFFEEAMRRGTRANEPLELSVAPLGRDQLAWTFRELGPVQASLGSSLPAGGLVEVEDAVARLRSAAERRLLDAPAELRSLGARIQALIPPSVRERALSVGQPVSLRLDESLAGIPFELAHDQERFWIERQPIARRLVTRASGVPPAATEPREQLEALLVSGPLATLPGAALEVEELAELLWRRAHLRTRVSVLADRRATRAALLAELPGAELLHWCGHTDGDARWALAKDETLGPAEIESLRLSARLVLANSCGPTRGPALARAFLLAGARNYVGTLWDVDDALARAFALRLYEELLLGHGIGAALDSARAHLRERDPLHWAAYVHYGHSAERLFEPVGSS